MLTRLFADLLAARRRRGERAPAPLPEADPFARAESLVRERDLVAAADVLSTARASRPDDERGQFLQAEILRLRGAFAEAMALYRRALIANPLRVDAWIGLGDCSLRAGDELQACIYYRTALSLEPQRTDVLNELGLIALSRGNFTEAAELFDQIVNSDPLHADGWNNFGLVAAANGDLQRARLCFHRAAHLRPGFYTAQCNLGLACRDLGRLDEAAETLVRATQAEPGKSAAWVNLASVRQDQGRLDESRAMLERAVAVAPDDPGIATAYGSLLAKLGEADAAEKVLASALAAAPDDPEANLAQAHLDLSRGRYAQGWDRYEARLRAAQSPRRRFPLPEWDGALASGRALLVYAEQGLGDTLMFASCLPDLMRDAASVQLHCEDRLWPLMERSFPGLHRYRDRAAPPADGYVAIGSLPRLYRRRAEDFPQHAGYLRAAPEQIARAAAALEALGPGPKVGIAWRGGLPSTGKAIRSLALADLEPLLGRSGVHWVSLQHGDTAAEIDAFARDTGIRIHRLPDTERDLDAAAGAIAALDRVVTVCSSVVHLAGALGRSTLVLTPHVPAWRYGLQGVSMPWYPSVVLLRQPAPGAWAPVLDAAWERLSHASD